jgi:NarL family two-component system sensor histidine kinase LiaS
MEQEQKFELELEGESKRYFDILISPLYEPGGKSLTGRLIISRDITDRRQAGIILEERLADIQKLNSELLETQAQLVEQQIAFAKVEERQRLARDMHDSVNQSIHSLMLFSETLVALLQKGQTQKALNVAERIQESGQRALTEIRLLLYKAQPILIDQNTDLIGILEDRLNMVERRIGINAEIICEDEDSVRVPSAWKENLYWITMEALNNSIKHSQAQNVNIIIHCTEEHLSLNIADDGVGFDPASMRSGGFGMKTMRERAALLGGELTIESTPGDGTQVQFKAELEN